MDNLTVYDEDVREVEAMLVSLSVAELLGQLPKEVRETLKFGILQLVHGAALVTSLDDKKAG